MAPRKKADTKPKAKAKPKSAKKPRTKAESTGTSETKTEQPKMGRPSSYTPEMGMKICKLLASGMTLTKICRDPEFPCDATVRDWALDNEHDFFPMYARARLTGYHRMADEIVDYSDDDSDDWTIRDDGDGNVRRTHNSEATARSRLKVDTRKWLLSKALPKIYGDKIALTDADGGKLSVEIVRFQAPGGGDGQG